MTSNLLRFKVLLTGILLCWHVSSASQDVTAGLYVCRDAQGMNNIVTKAQLPTAEGQCKPYTKGMFSSASNSPSQANFMSAPAAKTQPTTADTPLSALAQPLTLHAPEKTDTTFIAPKSSSFNDSQSNIAKPSIQPTAPLSIYMCPKTSGTHEVIEASEPPDDNCLVFNDKQDNNAPSLNRTVTDDEIASNKVNKASAEVALPPSPPQDIYKCFDQMGRASYVGANERHKFKQCSFFSKSFAGANAELRHKATQNYTLAELAASGLNSGVSSNAALKCTGAGKIEFNGQIKEYNCAARSFNYSPGSSGGSIELGDQRATIAAHRLEYFDSAGSCGGTVLAENGRILHLAPTKECPESFKIEARRIAKIVEKSLSINVSGAFKERQRTLAPQINQIANEVGVDPFLIHAVISAESAYKSRAVSHAGAQGLMQLMPATADRFGVSDSFHTGQNIRAGSTYLRWLLKEFNGNLELALAGYNAGEGNVRKYGYKIPPFIETRAYVPKVLEYYQRYRLNPSEVGL